MKIPGKKWRRIYPFELSKGFRNDLSSLMIAIESAATIGEKVEWIESLVDWIRISSSIDDKQSGGEIRSVRIRFFLQSLERNEHWKKSVSELFKSLFADMDSLRLLCETGLNSSEGFFSELSERILNSVIPSPRDDKDLAELFSKVFSDDSDSEWLESIDPQTVQSLMSLFGEAEEFSKNIRIKFLESISEAILIICSHLQSLGLHAEIRKRTYIKSVDSSAFSKMHFYLLDCLKNKNFEFTKFQVLQTDCRNEIFSAFAHLEEHGVSIALVYRLERMEKYLSRLELLVNVFFSGNNQERATLSLLANLVKSNHERRSLRAFLKHNLHMLSRKIVERTGISGEHYITQTVNEYWQMFFSAVGGGVLTAFTTLGKFAISKSNPAPFFEGFFSWINYSGSFLTMQMLHFTLATKQPSMTASALASHLKEGSNPNEFSLLVARIFRSQFISALGNIGAVIPTAIIIYWIQLRFFGTETLSTNEATDTLSNLNPIQSFTIFYAALTGIILWISSIGGGWTENWFVLRRIPETLAQSPILNKIFGKRTPKVSKWIGKNISGIGGNLSLGFLLAFVPVAGSFFGFPLEVRHVTLSAASLTFAFCSLDSPTLQQYLMGAFSIVCIGLLNFGVSFTFALLVAIRAREVRPKRLYLFRKALFSFLLQRWWIFFYPSKNIINIK
jgi:site-specific recombinase